MATIRPMSDRSAIGTNHVLFLHGLGGDPLQTWGDPDHPAGYFPIWLEEDLDGVSTWAVSYTAKVSNWNGSAKHFLDLSRNTLETLLTHEPTSRGSIFLFGHSLGGIVIKHLLLNAESVGHHRNDAKRFLSRVRGVVFFSTPHQGSALANLVRRAAILLRPSQTTVALVRNDAYLRDLNYFYRDFANRCGFRHLTLAESLPLKRFGIVVVPPDSSDSGLLDPPISIVEDHIQISKPSNRDHDSYRLPMRFIATTLAEHGAATAAIASSFFSSASTDPAALHSSVQGHAVLPLPTGIIDDAIKSEVRRLRRSRFFRDFHREAAATALSRRVQHGELQFGTQTVRCWALAWCARLLAIGETRPKAIALLKDARTLGSLPEVTIAEAFIAAGEHSQQHALQLLAHVSSPAAYSARLMIANLSDDAAKTLEWWDRAKLAYGDLDSDGKFVLLSRFLTAGRYDDALAVTETVTDVEYSDTPQLLFGAAQAYLMPSLDEELRPVVLSSMPVFYHSFPTSSSPATVRNRRKSVKLLERHCAAARELGFDAVADYSADFALWLRLLGSESKAEALAELQSSIAVSPPPLRRIPLAIQFGLPVDESVVEDTIESEIALSGGVSISTSQALLGLAFAKRTPADALAYLARHRDRILEHFRSETIIALEIELLCKAGRPLYAQRQLDATPEDALTPDTVARLNRVISEATGGDPLEHRLAQFESSQKLSDLISLVAYLEETRNWPSLVQFAGTLFARTDSTEDAVRLARALEGAGNYTQLCTLLRGLADRLDQSLDLRILWGWTQFREGNLTAAAGIARDILRNQDAPNARSLAFAATVASGEWERLHDLVEDEAQHRATSSPDRLLTTARIASAIRSPRVLDLLATAVEIAPDDPTVLAAAYHLATTSGIDDDALTASWLQRAADLSGDSGPLKRVSLAELVSKQPDWDRHATDLQDRLAKGEIPLFLAAHGLNRSLVELMLLSALSNRHTGDLRRKRPIPAFSGARQPSPITEIGRIGIDASALLTLGYVGKLRALLDRAESVHIPHSTLTWLFEEKQRARFHQPSRVNDARTVIDLLSKGQLEALSRPPAVERGLVREIGPTLAKFLQFAATAAPDRGGQHIVICSGPVYKPGSLMREEADLSRFHGLLGSCTAVAQFLRRKSMLTERQHADSMAFLRLQEAEWPGAPEICDNATLLLDDVSVAYLLQTGLLSRLAAAGLKAIVSERTLDESRQLVEYDGLSVQIEQVIEDIRSALAEGIRSGRVKVGPIVRPDAEGDATLRSHPTYGLFTLPPNLDAVCSDDRFFNRHARIETGDIAIPIVTSLDLLDSGLLNEPDGPAPVDIESRTLLRQSGYSLFPVTKDELVFLVSRADIDDDAIIESAELRALRESILLVRMFDLLRLPAEAPWIYNLTGSVCASIVQVWQDIADANGAGRRAKWLLQFLDLRGWAHSGRVFKTNSLTTRGLDLELHHLISAASALPPDRKTEFFAWLDRTVLLGIRENDPTTYQGIVEQARRLIRDPLPSADLAGC